MAKQRSRKTKTSSGLRKSSKKISLTPAQKVLMGGGMMDSVRPCGITESAWRGRHG